MKYENVVPELRLAFPFFFDSNPDLYVEFPYDVFGTFALMLQEKILAKDLDDTVLRSAFLFLERMAISEDLNVQNLLVVGVLEVMVDSEALDLAANCVGEHTKTLLAKWFDKILA